MSVTCLATFSLLRPVCLRYGLWNFITAILLIVFDRLFLTYLLIIIVHPNNCTHFPLCLPYAQTLLSSDIYL